MSAYDTEQLDRLEPAYLANYGLSQAPFSNQHDDRYLYLDAERAQRLNLLQHMTQYSNLLLVVLGEEGVGKSSLLTRFIKTKAENWHICQVAANTFMDAGQLLFKIAEGFGVPQLPQDSGEMQELLYAQVATYHHNDQIPILLIDDAHELPKDALLTIFHLADAQVDNANLLRIILFAEPQIEKVLNARDARTLRERITHTMTIPPLDEDTTAEYLKHRMAVAGFDGGSPFTPKMIKRIYKASGGNPGRINQFAHEMLVRGDFGREEVEVEEVEAMIKPEQPRRQYKATALITGVVILVVLVLVFKNSGLFQGKSTQTRALPIPLASQAPSSHSQPQTKPAVGTTQPAPSAPVAGRTTPDVSTVDRAQLQEKIIPLQPSPAKSPPQPPITAPGATSNTRPDVVTAPKPNQPVMGATQTPITVEQQPQAKPVVITPKVSSVEPDPVPPSDQPQTIIVHGNGFSTDSRVFVRWADKNLEIPSARVNMVSDTQLQVRLTVGRQHDKWQLHVVNPGHVSSNILTFDVAAPASIQDQANAWSLSQAPDSFTLQLFGSHELNNAKAFIRQHRLDKRAHYFVYERKGQTWYNVVYGVYSDQAVARSAIKTLPASLQKVRPWIRRFDAIQASIKASHLAIKSVPSKQALPRAAIPDSSVFSTAPPKRSNIEQNESWIWSQDPSDFTLQLLGARELASVKKFLARYSSLATSVIYFHTRHAGHDWYVVIYGVYPDKQKAKAAIKRLPRALQKTPPWIRQFASIHAELSRTQ